MPVQDHLNILIIDDNPEIHKDFIKILTKDLSAIPSELDAFKEKIFGESNANQATLPHFHIDTASQGKEGLEAVECALKENKPYALAFVDIRMPPGWDGIETIKRIWAIDADIQIVICTAYSDYSWEDTIKELGPKENLLILKKPFDSIAVRQLACALTKKWQLLQDTKRYTELLKQQVADRTASLQESLSLVKATLESSNNGILVINNEGVIVDYNQKFINMWQIPREVIEQKNEKTLRNFMKSQLVKPKTFFATIDKIFADNDAIQIETIKFKDGRIFEFYTQPQTIDDVTVGRVFDFRDVTKRAALEKKLEHQATHDALTELPNRIMLLDRIKQAIQTCEEKGTIFALLFLDLDRFKLINDSLSHAVGDEVLKITANRLRTNMRPQDTLARLGGDEFIILLTNLNKIEHVRKKIQQLQNVFIEPFNVENRHVIVSSSIGVSLYPKNGLTPDILLRNADAAMYRAKETRGNSVEYYTDEINLSSLSKLDEEVQLRKGLTNEEFFLCYQPQIDLKQKKVVAVEALIRWNHPEKGTLLPIDFIPLAEETGLIIPIGEWVLRAACKQNKIWQDKGFSNMRVAVNITAQQFMHQDIITLVKNVLDETQLSPEFLELELTENVIVSHSDIIRAINELKKLGITIAIDDFGTGYSNLSYLKKIPLDRLKIDKSFIQHIQSPTDDEVIIRAVIAMAKNLKLEVLVEGVETQEQLNFLKMHECADVQGLYFSKPLTADELENFLRNISQGVLQEKTEAILTD